MITEITYKKLIANTIPSPVVEKSSQARAVGAKSGRVLRRLKCEVQQQQNLQAVIDPSDLLKAERRIDNSVQLKLIEGDELALDGDVQSYQAVASSAWNRGHTEMAIRLMGKGIVTLFRCPPKGRTLVCERFLDQFLHMLETVQDSPSVAQVYRDIYHKSLPSAEQMHRALTELIFDLLVKEHQRVIAIYSKDTQFDVDALRASLELEASYNDKIALYFEREGDLVKAEKYRNLAQEFREKTVESVIDEKRRASAAQLANAHQKLGDFYMRFGKTGEASSHLTKARELRESLAAQSPD